MPFDPKPGDQYDEFRILDVLGAGGYALVCKVEAPGHERPLALKISKEPVVSEVDAQRALREIAILQSLTNPHVVRIHDSGLGSDERWFILMEYLEGDQLSAAHGFEKPMSPGLAVGLIHQACMGLAEAHAAGIVHRDIKPDNLWIEPDGTIKVLDFGFARAWEGNSTIAANATVGHMLVGTPHYAQPEQLEAGALSPASDVYSLAIILYELLSARAVFWEDRPLNEIRAELRYEAVKWLRAHALSPVVPITRYPECADLPSPLVSLLEAALDKDPSKRPPDAGAFANQLGWILHHDLGVAVGATLRVSKPGGAQHYHLLLPGSHRIGFGERCEVRLASDAVHRIHAVLEWAGPPKPVEVKPLRSDGSVRINGESIATRTQIASGDLFTVGPFELEVSYRQDPIAPRGPRSARAPARNLESSTAGLPLRVGDAYDQFKVLEVTRTYPTACVYKVESPEVDGPLALKLSLDPIASEEAARRALREIAVMGTLTNPHVVRIHDSGMGADERWFIVMDHLDGAQLNHWWEFGHPMPAPDAVSFIHQACLGLAEVHAAGVVHRDLKPETLWVEPDRTLKILDFGTARAWEGGGGAADDITTAHQVVGTPQYASPEQLDRPRLSPASDVYSLAIILYELLTGYTAFFEGRPWKRVRQELRDEAVTWLRAHAQQTPVPITAYPHCANLPPRLIELVHAALDKDPSRRPADASAFSNSLGWILHHDLGATAGGALHITHPNGARAFHLLLPGSLRIGYGPTCDIRLSDAAPAGLDVAVTVEWAGAPRPVEMLPERTDGFVRQNGQPVTARTTVAPGDVIHVGGFRIDVVYPTA